MKPSYNKHRITRARVFRVVAILFLVYTGLDMTVPQFCTEESDYPCFIQVTEASDLSDQVKASCVVAAPKNSPGGPTSDEHSQDEDCFCCCTHVLPGHVTAPVAIAELSPDFAALKKIDVASPLIRGPYHPPRLV